MERIRVEFTAVFIQQQHLLQSPESSFDTVLLWGTRRYIYAQSGVEARRSRLEKALDLVESFFVFKACTQRVNNAKLLPRAKLQFEEVVGGRFPTSQLKTAVSPRPGCQPMCQTG